MAAMSKQHTGDGRGPAAAGNQTPYAVMGYLLIFTVFGVFGAWSAFAKLDSAVIASGSVAVESNRKRIQHFEGGIVREILVKEFQSVNKGDVLFRLDPLQAEAKTELLRGQIDAALALEARLLAERQGNDHISFPKELVDRAGRLSTRKIMIDQEQQFKERRASIKGQIGILESRIEQLGRTIAGLRAVQVSTEGQIKSIRKEFKKVSGLAKRGYYPTNRLHTMEREIFSLEGRLGQTMADIARNENAIGESKLQIIHTRQKFQEEVIDVLRSVRTQLPELLERRRMAQDVLNRMEIRSPLSGVVQNLKVHTIGGVIRAGEPMLELVPINDTLQIAVRINPVDINHVGVGSDAEVRFPGFKSRTLPLIMGKVKSVSADRMTDPATNEPYYLSIVEVKETQIPEAYRGTLSAGMPADLFIATGERTVADYLLSPFTDVARKSLREL
ncbi:MAG: HlyD family type I secretion periplasmic adaptor subunit [Alphaproteobacteria bacterium]|nr:HlyD family type I secretion periplasmic adaptor subunit [Alphaproteobacteria bacterium]